jgi:adenylate cyclase
MAVKSELLSLVFTDLVDSTALKLQLGDQRAGELIGRHQERVRALRVETGGREVDTAGDGFFLTFDVPSAAVTFALRLQQIHHDEPELPKVRVGVHLGEVSERAAPTDAANPLFIEGLAVDLAGRIQSLAQPGQILVSAPVLEAAQQRLKGQEGEREIRWLIHGRYRLKGIGAPVEIGEAGFDDISPLKAPPDSEKARRVRAGARSITVLALAAAVVLAVGVGGWWLGRPTVDVSTIRSIAVLPLENLSGDPEQEYFADGMTEALISNLAKIAELKVISRTSVMQFKGARRPLREIAKQLGVDALIEGTVMRAENRVRITAQLIDARGDEHLWADSYVRDLRDVLEMQAEVARVVAQQVKLELTPHDLARLEPRGPVDPRAHDAILRSRYSLSQSNGGPDAWKRAHHYCEEAVAFDPSYAPAYACLAWTYS